MNPLPRSSRLAIATVFAPLICMPVFGRAEQPAVVAPPSGDTIVLDGREYRALSASGPGARAGDLAADFAAPPLELRGRPLWFWNGPLTRDGIREAMERSRESGYCGFGILPSPGHDPRLPER